MIYGRRFVNGSDAMQLRSHDNGKMANGVHSDYIHVTFLQYIEHFFFLMVAKYTYSKKKVPS